MRLVIVAGLCLVLGGCVLPTPTGKSDPYVTLAILNMLTNAQRPVPRYPSTTWCRQTDVGLWCDTF